MVISQASTGTLAEALLSSQGFVTGSLELDANYSTGWLTSINRPYDSAGSLKLYVDPSEGTHTTYDTLAGGFSFPDDSRNVYDGYKGWSLNSPEAGRALRYLLPGETNDRFPDFELSYTSYGIWYVDSVGRYGPLDEHDQHDFATFFYFGIPTALTDLLRSGTANYRGIAEGRLYDLTTDYELKGTAELFANFASGDVGATMQLNGTDLSNGSVIDFGTFDGIAILAADANAFSGTWFASSAGFEGSILGSFFGPEAAEFGYTFGINKPDLSAIGGGVVVGGRTHRLRRFHRHRRLHRHRPHRRRRPHPPGVRFRWLPRRPSKRFRPV
jgi:hypothetical protein